MVKVAVALSGGVDSAVAAALLKESGNEVFGISMRIWDGELLPGEGTRHGCYGPEEEGDLEDAFQVARALDIPFYIFDLRQEYKKEVMNYFRGEYLSGRTPNPCIRCNCRVKFDALLQRALDSGINFDYAATGHYARVEFDQVSHRYLLQKARDKRKDQSYFLSFLSQKQLGRSLFPLGDYTKEEVREIARKFKLGVKDKPESQNFIAGGYSALLEGRAMPGLIVDNQGKALGEHRGIPFYTIGQRRGLGISQGKPLYVTAIDTEKNAIVVGAEEEVYRGSLIASGLNWIAIERLHQPMGVKAKIRYLHEEAEAVITSLGEGKVCVKFKEPQRAITPGQTVVFYDGDVVIGGGTIENPCQT